MRLPRWEPDMDEGYILVLEGAPGRVPILWRDEDDGQ